MLEAPSLHSTERGHRARLSPIADNLIMLRYDEADGPTVAYTDDREDARKATTIAGPTPSSSPRGHSESGQSASQSPAPSRKVPEGKKRLPNNKGRGRR